MENSPSGSRQVIREELAGGLGSSSGQCYYIISY